MLLKRDRRYVAALCMELWEWVDESTTDGKIPSASPEQVDIIVDFPGFGDSLVAVGWMIRTPNGIEIPNFTRHNGETAKSRALAALRKANQRKKESTYPNQHDQSVTNVTPMSRSERDKSVTREEKRREETEEQSTNDNCAPVFARAPKPHTGGSGNGSVAGAVDAEKPKAQLTLAEASAFPVPITWDADTRKAWDAFVNHRYAMRRKLTAHAIDLLQTTINEMPQAERPKRINESIANGWQGIFPATGGTNGKRIDKPDKRAGEHAESLGRPRMWSPTKPA